ncbi:fusion protein of aspartate kinase and homoserine dehydrogenase [Gracilaria domingensis]|nr:fusion protein of aspartate kinase and homoserine dehydrogenase [Gracilaria domingensis]
MPQGLSEHNIFVVVDSKSESRALTIAHFSFYLSDQTVSLGLIVPGIVRSAFQEQIYSQPEKLEQQFSVYLRVRSIPTSRKMVFGEPLDLDDESWRGLLKFEEAERLHLNSFADHIQDSALLHAVICDCTASEEISGTFSATLSFIFNEFGGSEPFSAIVAKAKDNGYTEPDPRDDLSGIDVARKVVIAASEIGIKFELDPVPVERVVHKERQGSDISVEEFMQRVPDFDSNLTSVSNRRRKLGNCYVMWLLSIDNPFGRLQSSNNIVSLGIIRYDAKALVVPGPGSGTAVTAAGVSGYLLRLTGYIEAPSREDSAKWGNRPGGNFFPLRANHV